MIPETITHYKISRKLGEGGMGEVYLAVDTNLDRQVALKVLPPAFSSDPRRLARFTREARAASAINHPNVAHIYEIGECDGISFIAMEYAEGVRLDDKIGDTGLGEPEMVEIAMQLADALAEAHSRRVIHRDLKPSNIVINTRGQAKILDFGLAKFSRPESSVASSDAATIAKTAPGILIGTPQYMSPEQALGRDLDHRSDIFSLGVVLYQMSTGKPPFIGHTVMEIINSIINHDAGPMPRTDRNLSPTLERLVRKCLEKDPAHRYQSAVELLADLRELKEHISGSRPTSPPKPAASTIVRGPAAPATVEKAPEVIDEAAINETRQSVDRTRSIAVLPFKRLSNESDDEYLGIGIADALITRLSNVQRITVRPTSAVLKYAAGDDPVAAGRELNVDSVLDGNIRRSGDRLRITVQLVDAGNGVSLWAGKFDEKFTDIFTLEDRVSEQVVAALTLELTGEEWRRLKKRDTQNPIAHQEYLKGRYYLAKRTEQGYNRAIEFFNRAIELDASYAQAFAMLADCYGALSSCEALGLAPREAMPKAKSAAATALQLDDKLAEAHTSLGLVRLNYDWDWAGAERELRRAIDLNPYYGPAYHWLSHYFLTLGLIPESQEASLRALEIDPLDPDNMVHLAYHYYCAREYDLAVDQCKMALDMDSSLHEVHTVLAGALEQKGMLEEAIAEFQVAVDLSGGRPLWIAGLGHAYALSGQANRARKVIEQLGELSTRRYVSPVGMAMVYQGLGEGDQALRWLEESRAQRCSWLPSVKADPIFDGLRGEPAFRALFASIGLKDDA